MKSLVTLHLAVLQDAGLLCATNVSRDAERLITRTEHEGESFLTITLPTFVKALEKGLHDGVWPRRDMTSFAHVKGLPAFLRGFLSLVFHDDGSIRDDPDVNAIWAVRQFGNLSQKIERDCSPARVDAAYDTFIETDNELRRHFEDSNPSEQLWAAFDKVALSLFGGVFDELETSVSNFAFTPRHGPGAVADRLDHVQRWDFGYWTERLESVFPSWRYTQNTCGSAIRDLVPIEDEIPVRVIDVPKTQKTPRMIAIEPSSIQYAQQGLKRDLYRLINGGPLRFILGFTDQERNQELALAGSLDGSLATLDLSEASDRVHVDVVARLFRRWPHLGDYVMATRSMVADVRGEQHALAKFASMGSALTFPIEAMVFTIIAFMGSKGSGVPLSARAARGRISVYGDDIIVPVDAVDDVVGYLEAFGFKVNKHKSFWTGRFRESCGKEYYDGTDVSIVRLRAEVPTSRRDAALVNRFTDFRNRAYRAGLWRTVKAADEMLDRIMSIPHRLINGGVVAPFSQESEESSAQILRRRNPGSGLMARDTVLRTSWRARWNAELHIWQETYPSVKPARRPYKVDGEGGLLKWFYENQDRDDRYQIDLHEGQERAHTFRIKWVRTEVLPNTSVVGM